MTVADLIKEFSSLFELPIEVDRIEAALRARGVEDEIYCWHDVDLPTEHMKGYVERWSWEDDSTGKKTFVTDITYGHMPNDYARMVCAKELIHILDPDSAKVQTEEEIDRQISKIVLIPNMQDAFNDPEHVVTDRRAIIQALALLFPLAARDALYTAFKERKISVQKLAQLSELPPSYVAIVMSDMWPELHAHLVRHAQ